jgi:AraC-like DNA-binding protein
MVGIIKPESIDNSEIISDFAKISNEYIKAYYLSIPMNSLLLIILNFEESEYEKILYSLADIIDYINKNSKSDICISLGGISEFDNVGKSYFEAYMVEIFRWFGGQKQEIYSFNDIIKNMHNPSSGFCPGYIKDLELSVLRADVEYIAKFPSMIIQQISTCALPGYYINYIIYEMIRVFIIGFENDKNHMVILEKIWDFIYDNSPVLTAGKLEDIITFICNTIIQNIQQNPATIDPALNDILQYINDNYNKPDFSIQMTADHFNMSPSWLSHYFKSNMHITIMEFVQNKKIKYAQQLILNNERSINEISEQLGYCNVYSFVRAFKKAVKMTPSQYKEVLGNSKPVKF